MAFIISNSRLFRRTKGDRNRSKSLTCDFAGGTRIRQGPVCVRLTLRRRPGDAGAAAGGARRSGRGGREGRCCPGRPSHEWVPGESWDLIVTMDDATSEIYSAFFVAEEGTMSTFRALTEVIAEHGLLCALYADRGSHYWHTPTAGGKVDRDNPTQVGRALGQLGVELIPAYSPEARGRSERMFATLQDRLPKEFRLAGITARAWTNFSSAAATAARRRVSARTTWT